jgi:hypothetical protein
VFCLRYGAFVNPYESEGHRALFNIGTTDGTQSIADIARTCGVLPFDAAYDVRRSCGARVW